MKSQIFWNPSWVGLRSPVIPYCSLAFEMSEIKKLRPTQPVDVNTVDK